ncbi:MAG: nucleotide sugar dehydrogenase [Terriglobia bacterium]
MRISVFGLGYVGCVSAACLAEAGHQVIGVDVVEDKVDMINRGTSPIVEPGLAELIAAMIKAERLKATTSGAQAVSESDLALICVGTPGYRNGRLNTDILDRVCRMIGEELRDLRKPFSVVVRSTMLPGSTQDVVIPALHAAGAPADLKVGTNPEFIREGSALNDFSHPPFTLVGSEDEELTAQFREVYAGVDAPFISIPVKTAEMVKYACNSFHGLKVCFANEIGDISTALGADAGEVMRIFCMDQKLNISPAYLRPGFAFGGSCLPKDLRALNYAARSADVEAPLLSSILPSNKTQIENAVTAVLQTGKRRIGIVGLSFKQNTDDLRESPMVTLVEALIGKGCEVKILDNNVSLARLMGANRRYIEEEIPHIASVMCTEADELLDHAEVLVVGNGGEEAERLVATAAPELPIVDLTRITARPQPDSQEEPRHREEIQNRGPDMPQSPAATITARS